MSQLVLPEDRECRDQCKSTQHGALICATLTKRQVQDAELCAYLQQVCCSCERVKDDSGRTALHMAASCGRMSVVKWLITAKQANVNIKDEESGYTALHRSIYYGKINVAVSLMKLGANTTLTDFNGLTFAENAMMDCERFTAPLDEHGEVYVWGSNTNYTLGPQQARIVPELLDAYHRGHPSSPVKQICLEKFHCALVSTDGKVFTCGHGQGGRLGLSNENTVLVPEQIKFGTQFNPIARASIAIDHSVFLSETGNVWTCGLNTHRVLGLSGQPKQILTPTALPLFDHKIEDVCAGKYHTVAWGSKAIYSWGLHGGQLGHNKTDQKYVVAPKVVTCLFGLDSEITVVAVSNAATAVITKRGDIYVLYEYRCRKIATRQLGFIAVTLVGGKLDNKIDNAVSEENHELVIVILSGVGNLYLWKESDPVFVRCMYSINRCIKITQVTLNHNEILIVTQQGEAFQGTLKPKNKKISESGTTIRRSGFFNFFEKENCYVFNLTKIPRVHRAITIHSDLKGRNYAVLQANPKSRMTRIPKLSPTNMHADMQLLLSDSTEDDVLHDVVFKVARRIFPAHHYIIATKSTKLHELITAEIDKVIELSNIDENIFEQLLVFIYTGKCDLIETGKCPDKFEKSKKTDLDPIRLLQTASKRFGVQTLKELLDVVYYENGCILTKLPLNLIKPKFDRSEYADLRDVVLKSKNGKEIYAHKCILAARLEYFYNMFSSRWIMNVNKEVTLEFSYGVLEQLLNFLYTDELPQLDNEDIEHICSLLVLADQLFVSRLKEICESTLSTFVTLKNISQFLSLSCVYNASQLKHFCMEFICNNLTALLELKVLESFDDSVLNELTEFYSNYSVMQNRMITPYSFAPSDSDVNAAGQVNFDDEDDIKISPKTKKRSRPKRNTTSDKKSISECDVEIAEEISESPLIAIDNKRESSSPMQIRLKAIKFAQDAINCDSTLDEYALIPLRDFPELSHTSISHPKNYKIEKVKSKITKISQKERKRLSSENNSSLELTPPQLSESPKNPWKIIDPIPNTGTNVVPNTSINSIIHDEKKQKENFVKMKTKLLVHTQMEDKAIEDLKYFYNVDNIFDEIVSINRVQNDLIASPVWVHLNNKKR